MDGKVGAFASGEENVAAVYQRPVWRLDESKGCSNRNRSGTSRQRDKDSQ